MTLPSYCAANPEFPRLRMRFLKLTAALLGSLLIMVGLAAFAFAVIPLDDVDPGATPEVTSFEQAQTLVAEWSANEAAVPDLNPVCASRFLPQDAPAERVAVLFHGFTNCPAQWELFAGDLHEAGWAVVVPRIPGHGLTTDEPLETVTAEEIAYTVRRSVAIAGGLGERVAVAGLSSGGVFAAWEGTQEEVDLVLSIAPAFTLAGVPSWSSGIIDRAARVAPNFWWWWDGDAKESLEGPAYAYKRFPTRAFGQVGRLGQVTIRREPTAEPGRVVFLLNPVDPAVNNDVPERLAARWAARGWDVTTEYFPADGLPHDVVDPNQPGGRIDETYPVIRSILETEVGS